MIPVQRKSIITINNTLYIADNYFQAVKKCVPQKCKRFCISFTENNDKEILNMYEKLKFYV